MAYPLQPITLDAATVTITPETHGETLLVVDRAAGVTATLPDATGSGAKYTFILKTTVTSNSFKVQVPDADNTMTGTAILGQDAADTAVLFETASTTDTITMNGSTTGGIKGDIVECWDLDADLWFVRVLGSATGTEATPFSAAVS